MSDNLWPLRFTPCLHSSMAVGLLAITIASFPLSGQTWLTQNEALRIAFPEPATIERQTAFLSENQLRDAQRLAAEDVEITLSVVTYYVARSADTILGVAYFDAHRVRTLPEVLMIVLTSGGEVARIEVLKFAEPTEYKAPERWIELFYGEQLSDELSLKRKILNITGATLTSRAVTASVRRVLALHAVIDPLRQTSNR